MIDGSLGHQIQHSVAHGKTSSQNGNDRHLLSDLRSVEIHVHRSSNGLRDALEVSRGLITQIESDFLQNLAKVGSTSLHVSQDSHFVTDQRMGSDM